MQNIIYANEQTGKCLLAINKHGIRVININDREELLKIALIEVILI